MDDYASHILLAGLGVWISSDGCMERPTRDLGGMLEASMRKLQEQVILTLLAIVTIPLLSVWLYVMAVVSQ